MIGVRCVPFGCMGLLYYPRPPRHRANHLHSLQRSLAHDELSLPTVVWQPLSPLTAHFMIAELYIPNI